MIGYQQTQADGPTDQQIDEQTIPFIVTEKNFTQTVRKRRLEEFDYYLLWIRAS